MMFLLIELSLAITKGANMNNDLIACLQVRIDLVKSLLNDINSCLLLGESQVLREFSEKKLIELATLYRRVAFLQSDDN